jgi:hypothetical protein
MGQAGQQKANDFRASAIISRIETAYAGLFDPGKERRDPPVRKKDPR